MLPGDEEKINEQVKDAQATVDKEAADWDAERQISKVPEKDAVTENSNPESTAFQPPEDRMETVGDAPKKEEDPSGPDIADSDANVEPLSTRDEPAKADMHEASKDHGADGEEVVEGEEDTVIY